MPIDRGEAAIRTSIASAIRRTTKFIAGTVFRANLMLNCKRTDGRHESVQRCVTRHSGCGLRQDFLSFAPPRRGNHFPLRSSPCPTAAPKPASPVNRLGPPVPTFSDRDTTVASAPSMPRIDLQVSFDFNSAQITPEAEGQLRELGKALDRPKLKGATTRSTVTPTAREVMLSTSACRSVARSRFKTYLVDNFGLTASNLRAVGYGKARLKNTSDPFAAENRRVEVVNMVSSAGAALMTALAPNQFRDL